jgi:hypothetical protein
MPGWKSNVDSSSFSCRIPVPDDTFEDYEQGNTRNLRLLLKMDNGSALGSDSWIQFDPLRQSIYGL